MPKIDPAKVNNIFDAYLQYQSETECPPQYHRWSMISCLGAFLRRNFFFQHGPFTIYPNMYTMLIGDPGARKSTAIKQAKKLIIDAGFTEIAADKTSKEKFLSDLAGDNVNGYDDDKEEAGTDGPMGRVTKRTDVSSLLDLEINFADNEPRCCLIAADEFNEFVGSNNIEFLSTLGNLWDYDGIFKARTKNSGSIRIPNPTISILSGNTHENFLQAFPPEASGQGILSRILLIYGKSTGVKIAFPPVPDPADHAFLLTFLAEIQKVCHGPATLAEDAREALEYIYHNWQKLDDPRLANYGNRRFTQLLKLCLIHAAARISKEISLSDVFLANTVLTHAELHMPDALGEYGKSKSWDVAGKVIKVLEDAVDEGKPGLTSNELMKKIRTDIADLRDFSKIIELLAATGKIGHASVDNVKVHYPIRTQIKTQVKQMYDFKLLQELEL